MTRFSQLEFHRAGIGLLGNPREKKPGSAIYLRTVAGSQRPLRFCSCSVAKRKTCRHLLELSRQLREYRQVYGSQPWDNLFAASLWYRLAQLLFEGEPEACEDARVAQGERGGKKIVRVTSHEGRELAQYLDHSPATVRFLERTGKAPRNDSFMDRAGLLERLRLFLRTPEEQHLNKVGFKTNRQSLEESFWYYLAYHSFREYDDATGSFHPAVEEKSGEFTLIYRDTTDKPIFKIVVPRLQVKSVLRLLSTAFPNQPQLAIHPIPLRTLFMISQTTELDVEVRPVIEALQETGEARFIESESLEKFRYGNLVFLKELSLLAELERPAGNRKFRSPRRVRLERGQVPSFLEEHAHEIEEGTLVIEDPTRDLQIFRDYESLEIVPEEMASERHSLNIRYRFGGQPVALVDLLNARRTGLPYLETEAGWIDLNAPSLRGLEGLLGRQELTATPHDAATSVEVSSADLLRLQASSPKPIRIQGPPGRTSVLERLLALRPSEPFTAPEGLLSDLRPYQHIGAEWLKFLYENGLAGLLCDDMGLGKTHQAMALMLLIREQKGIEDPFLVVCPRTVISHWRNKLKQYAPGLMATPYHGPERDLNEALAAGDLLLTSYGVLRNDAERLKKTGWGLVVFDEVQQIKNRDTLSYRAARTLRAQMRLGLTGTPIENNLMEFKSLFDLILPDYLGSDEEFRDLVGGVDEDASKEQTEHLRRLTAPFVLRRLKGAVLDDLPEKIEDTRTCNLSDEQLQLYRDAVATRGRPLVEKLKSEDQPTPYIHIFALLNLLKQICDQPALALGKVEAYAEHDSGKWDLFQELLTESLDSGQKVVVFSQYLGMISIMESYLRQLGVEFVTLTGASRRRGEIVDRFNHHPRCRVFLGSLRAGGTGIDLIGGSVVIHYDRWWNAAREDQATDRVYRIGQKRAVQVFKLLTEGTLEERIALIIQRKRRLLSNVVEVDDPKLSKIFSRAELIELLQQVE